MATTAVAFFVTRYAFQLGVRPRLAGTVELPRGLSMFGPGANDPASHPGPSADLDPDRGEVGSSPIIGAVRIARRHAHARPSFDEWSDDANGVSEDVLAARDRPTLKIPRRDFDTKRGRDRNRPRHPLKLCSVHGDIDVQCLAVLHAIHTSPRPWARLRV